MRPTVLLFDVDGTLVTTGGVGRRALQRAFARVCQVEDACAHFRFDGMTDRAIVREGLRASGEEPTPERMQAVLTAYLEELEEGIAQADPARYRVHAGMAAALDATCGRPGFAVGLGTGNIREGARLKLARVGLFERFPFGGFGCDHEDRVELIRTGAERGAEALGVARPECRVVVIGDTPKDVFAAKGIGAECVGVGTGSFTPRDLRDAGADWAFDDLSAPGALEVLCGGAARQ